MKKIIAFLIIAVMLCGCSNLTNQDNIINLLSAPQLNQDEGEVVAAIKEYLERDVYLKYPKQLSDISPVQILDIDNDKNDEAVVIYSAPSLSSNVRLAVLEQTREGWAISHDSEGFGTDLYKIEFEKLTGSKSRQIIVGYTFSDSSEKLLSVYEQTGRGFETIGTYSCQAYTIADITEDGTDDIVLTGVNADDQYTAVQVISWREETFEIIGSSPLGTQNARVTNIAMTGGNRADSPMVLIDYYDTNRRVHTEVFSYDEGALNSVVSKDTVVKKWDAFYNLNSMDTDMDGVIETPTIITDQIVNSANIRFMEWTAFSEREPQRKLFGICLVDEGLFVPLPESWQGLITPSDAEILGEYTISSKTENEEIVRIEVLKTGIIPKKLTERQRLVSRETLQILFTFAEDVVDTDIRHMTEDIFSIK